MDIVFTKISDKEHAVRVVRTDGSGESTVLNSRSFLRHDLAHLAVESEVPIALGYWGSVAQGATLDGLGIRGRDIVIAESLAGPVQTLIRLEADDEKFFAILARIRPEIVTRDLASRIRERGRKLEGHWKGTRYGGEMELEWDEDLRHNT